MIDSRLYEAFVSSAEAGSISEAARKLGVPRATVSRRLGRLEEELGVRLIQRSTRDMTLTRAGHRAYHQLRALLSQAEATEAVIRQADNTPRGLLRVSTPPGPGAELAQFFARLLHDYPEIELEVLSTTRHVDLIGEGFDLALRAGESKDPRLYVRRLLTSQRRLVAAPAYLAARGRPEEPEQLKQHSCLVGFEGGVHKATRWPLQGGGWLQVQGRVMSNDMSLLLEGALAGLGLAMLPMRLAARHVQEGRLEVVLGESLGDSTHFCAVYPEREYIDPKVRVCIDRLVELVKDDALHFQVEPSQEALLTPAR